MNILILNWRDPKNPHAGGAEAVTMMHAKAWVAYGHTVTWFTSRFAGAVKHEKINGVDLVRYGTNHTVYLAAPFYYLFSKQSFDIVIDEIHGLPFFTPLYVRKPKIAFIHEVAGEIWDYMSIFPFNVIGKFIESFYFYFYRQVTWWTDAPSTIDDLVRHGTDRSKCAAIPCPVMNKILGKLPEKEKNITFIAVSRLVKMKGIEDVIRSFFIISRSCARARLWIVGAGDKQYVARLKLLVHDCDIGENVLFLGSVTEARKLELMRRAHLLLHASVKEGWGLVVTEAASQATPSVVYNVSGLRDSVINGETGVVIRQNNPEEMAKESLALVEDGEKYRKFQLNCIKMARSLTEDKITVQSLSLLKLVSHE